MATVGQRCPATGNPARGRVGDVSGSRDQVSVADLTKGIIIQSGNDACIALADYVAGSREPFIGLDERLAKRPGINEYNLPDGTHGLMPWQFSTARDICWYSARP